MIWESGPWRKQLIKDAEWLKNFSIRKKVPSEDSLFKFEQKIFLAAYSIRKLSEAKKIPDSVSTSTIGVSLAARFDTTIHHHNWHQIDRHFELSNIHHETRKIEFFCNQIIHSNIFIEGEDTKGAMGFWVASKKNQEKGLFFCLLLDWVALMNLIANSDVVETLYSIDPESGEQLITLK